MTDLHPHWHSTGDDDAAPRMIPPVVQKTPRASSRVAVRPASRLPAAVVGIVVCTVIGFVAAGGWDAVNMSAVSGTWQQWTAQVSGDVSSTIPSTTLPPIEIHITAAKGFNPKTVTAKPGQKLTWVNDQSIPHILTSQTLRDGSGKYLNTPAIFPGARTNFTIGPSEPERENTVTSTTDQNLIGTIIVSRSAQPSSTATSSKAQPLGNLEGVNLPTGQGTRSASSVRSASSRSSSARTLAGGAGASSSLRPPAATLPPGEPGTAGAAPVYPPQDFAGTPPTIDQYAPVDTGYGAAPLAANAFPPVNPEPMEQPHTGPGLWAVFLMSIALLWRMTRKYFVRL